MSTRNTSIIIITIMLAFLLLYNYSNIKTEYIPNSPDEAQTRFFANHFIETGGLKWESELNNKYDTSIFAPRNLADLGNNVYAPKKPLFYVLNMATFSVFSKIEYFTPIFGVFGIMVFFLILRRLFSKNIALVSSILIGISPVYLMYSNFYWENVPAFVLTFLSYYTFLRFIESKKVAYLLLTSIFLAGAIFMRPVDVLSISLFVIMLLFLYRKSFNAKSIVLGGFTFFISCLPYLFINKLVYGGFFSIPEIMRASSYLTQMDYDILPMGITSYKISFLNNVVLVEIVSAMALIGILFALLRGNSHQRRFSIAALIFCFSIFIFYGARSTTYAFGTGDISASVNRYFLPISVMLYLFAGVFVCALYSYFKKTTAIKPVISTLILSIVICSLLLGFMSTGGVNDRSSTMRKWSQRMGAIRQLPENSIIFTAGGDKYIYPTRNIAIVYTDESPKVKDRPDIALIYRILDVDNDIIPLIMKLNNDKWNVYIAYETDTVPIINRLKEGDRLTLKRVETWLSKIELR